MSSKGIQPNLLKKLRDTLFRCGPFDTDADLKNIFVDARIEPWSDGVPEATDKVARVNALVEYLCDQFADDTQESALALFLRVVGESRHEKDACHRQLIELAKKVESLFTPSGNSGRDVNRIHDLLQISTPPDLEFANRQDLLAVLTGTDIGPYHLIDAPTQYGKSKLLEQVQIRWRQNGWACARIRICVEDVHTLQDLVQALLSQLEVPIESWGKFLATSDFGQAGRYLGEWLKADLNLKLSDDPAFKAGVVLLFDIDGNLPDTLRAQLIIPLLNEFIPALESVLSRSQLSQEQRIQHILRVQVAGRYVGRLKNAITSLRSWIEHRLSPFNYKHVLEATSKYLGDDTENLEGIASHLMYYTAGHPGCIARILQSLKLSGESCEKYFCGYRDTIWDMVGREAYHVRQSIKPETMCAYMDSLSVFRYLDQDTLSLWMAAEEPTHSESSYDDAFALEKALLDTQLMHYDKDNISLLRDSIARGLLARHLLLEKGAAAFAKRCEQARAICERYLEDPSAQLPALWAMEALFQSLQCHISEIHSPRQREELRQTFFDITLPQVLSLLIMNRQNSRRFIEELRRALDTGTYADELEFMVNYFLREDAYTDEPYGQLKDAVAHFSVEAKKGAQ